MKKERIKPNVLMIALVAATGGLLFGFDTGVISGALPFLKEYWQLSDASIEWINLTVMLLGIDIGGTKCALVIGNLNDKTEIDIIDKRVLSTDRPVYEMIELIFQTAETLLAENHISMGQLSGIGISCGGPLSSKKGLILSPPNLPGWDSVPIVEMATKLFNKSVTLQNDANACAIAEWKYGAGKGFENVIFLTFGTGMGAGLILNGSL